MWKIVLVLASLLFSLVAEATSGRLLRDENLRREPGTDARVLTLLARDAVVDILERQGGWLRVGTPQGDGWVRLLSVRGDVAAQLAPLTELRGELAPASRRLESRFVAIAGFRGAEEQEQIEAAGRAALEKLETYRLSASRATAEATSLGLASTRLAPTCDEHILPELDNGVAASGARLSLMSAWLLNRLSAEDEAKIGRALAVRLLTAVPAVDDANLQRYVNRVGRWLVTAQGGRLDSPWLFAVLDSEEVYAHAMPGGHVFITLGLYRLVRDEAELAAVLAREIAHLGSKRLLSDLRQHAANTGRPPDEAAFLRHLLGNGLDALMRPYSVESEYQTDQIAVLLAARAGYDPYGLAAFLQILSGFSERDPRVALLSRTHPRADARLARLSRTLETCLADLPPGKAPQHTLYRMNH